MKKEKFYKMIKRGIIPTILVSIVIVAYSSLVTNWEGGPIKDEEFRSNFVSHRKEFEQLREMILSEPKTDAVGTERVGNYWITDGKWQKATQESNALSDCGLTRGRYETYLALLKKVGSSEVLKNQGLDPRARVRLWFYGSGIASGSVSKDVVWAPGGPSGVIDTDTRHIRNYPPEVKVINAHLDRDWYIQIDRD